jgi:archaeosine synthase
VDSESEWTDEQALPDGSDDRVVVLPHRGFPSGTDTRIQSAFDTETPDIAGASAAVITPETARDCGADVYILSTAQGLIGHARGFVDAIIETRNNIPSDTGLYLSGVGTPRNAAMLVYAGVDLLDEKRAVINGKQGIYLTNDDERPIESLSELPCGCQACDVPLDEFTRESCVEHNKSVLAAELARVRARIKDGTLRDYIEGQARFTQWCTGVFREIDQEWNYSEERTPIARRSEIRATSDDTMRRVEIRRFADRVTNRYTNRFEQPLVLVPCSARKP